MEQESKAKDGGGRRVLQGPTCLDKKFGSHSRWERS